MSRVAVLGGGISGLSAAYYLARLSPPTTKIVLIEAKDRLGGWIKSNKLNTTTNDSSVLFESGPRTLRPKGPSGTLLLEMIQHLNLNDERLVTIPADHPSAQNRYIYYDGKINTLPNKLSTLLFNKPPICKSVLLAGALEPLRSSRFDKQGLPKDGQLDESIYSFMERRFNKHTAINLMGALTHGVYAGDIKTLSLQSTFRMLYEAERNYGSVVVGMMKGAANTATMRERGMAVRAKDSDPDWYNSMEKMSIIGFKDGLETLPRHIYEYLKNCDNVEFVINDPVQSITTVENNNEAKIKTNKSEYYADHVISTLPSFTLDKLIPNTLPHLSYNPAADVAVVNFAYEPDVKLGYDGFGFLTPHRDTSQKIPVPGTLGVIFDSNVIPEEQQKRTKVTAMLGGSDWKDIFGNTPIDALDPNQALEATRQVMKQFLNIEEEPTHSLVNLQKQCIPHYLVGHQERIYQLHHATAKKFGHLLSLTGASYMGVSVPDCIKNSRMLVEELLVSGSLGSREKIVTGLANNITRDIKDSIQLSKGNTNVILKA
ncbi:protoporphyrinogen oxidase [Thamnidium elegans]|nr:protoporphyrinogen oxidase [Thamnidium elegans]